MPLFTGTVTKVEQNGPEIVVSFFLLDANKNGINSSVVMTQDIYNQTNGWFKPGQPFTKDLNISAGGKTLVVTFSFK